MKKQRWTKRAAKWKRLERLEKKKPIRYECASVPAGYINPRGLKGVGR